jgi:hypothetical protein
LIRKLILFSSRTEGGSAVDLLDFLQKSVTPYFLPPIPRQPIVTRHGGSVPKAYSDLMNIPVIANEVKQST